MLRPAAAGVLGCLAVVTAGLGSHPDAAPAAEVAPSDDRPNIVFILMDDASTELLATMPNAQAMRAEGAHYRDSYVVDSLCCPSRAALLTGQAPHQTGVLVNTPGTGSDPIGGYDAFVAHANEPKQFSVALQDDGYVTGFVGKFMNGYAAKNLDGELIAPPPVPGWTEWEAMLGGGYNGWGFLSAVLDEDGQIELTHTPKPPVTEPDAVRDAAYVTNVMADSAVSFIDRHRDGDQPWFLEIATYGPHMRLQAAYPGDPLFPPALADRAPAGQPAGGNCGLSPCGQLTLADLVGYDDPREDNAPTYLRSGGSTVPAPAWRTNPVTLPPAGALTRYRDRARMVQSIDRLIGRVRDAVGPDTYVVLTSDNGFHLGQHQLNGGKGTPYDSDTRVPLVVVGPGIAPGPRPQTVSNIDLASTFEDLAGLESPGFRSGQSFLPSLRNREAPGGRFAFYEHTHAKIQPGEVEVDMLSGGTLDIIPSYLAVRGKRGLLVRVDLDNSPEQTDYAWELYRYDVPWEDRNVFAEDHEKPWVQELKRRLEAYDGCAPAQCRQLTR